MKTMNFFLIVMCDIVGFDTSIDKKRIEIVMKNAESMVGKKIFKKDDARVWIGLRPVSPDGIFI